MCLGVCLLSGCSGEAGAACSAWSNAATHCPVQRAVVMSHCPAPDQSVCVPHPCCTPLVAQEPSMWPTASIKVVLAIGNVLLHWHPELRCSLKVLQIPGRLRQLLALVLLDDKGDHSYQTEP